MSYRELKERDINGKVSIKKRKFLILCLLFLSSCTINKNPYIKDLNFIYTTIEENHPGIYNDQDLEFNKNFNESYNYAKTRVIESKNSCGSKESISKFAASFNDTHLWVSWDNTHKNKLNQKIIRSFSVSLLSKNIAWITLPTFNFNIHQEKGFDQLIKEIPKLRSKKYIIFDLRGNQGGNSEYGSQVINALFGEEYVKQKCCTFNKKVYVDWRVSKGNLNHISSLLVRYPNSWLQNIQHGLKKSISQNKHYYREFSSDSCASYDLQTESTLDAKVIVVIDSLNVSAALDFIDALKMMTTNLTLIGKTTKADRLYMEVRSVSLPSGLGSFSFPIKVYGNRERLDNQPYIPDIQYKNVNNTSALRSFILTQIKEEKL